MATLKAPQQGRGHRRAPSDDRRQAAVLSPSTKGPLEEDVDIPAATIVSPSRDRSKSPLAPSQQQAIPGMDQTQQTITNLLCRPEIYRPLPPNMIPQAFLSSVHAAKADASVTDLVRHGQFYAAAITSARHLSNLTSGTTLEAVFDLFYTRLACLSLINKTCLEIAAVESLELRDMTAAMYLDPVSGEHVAPWHLRVLTVRLQAIGFKDWRRGVMSYYILAHDARQQVARARREQNAAQTTLWELRLRDVGIRVANMLVEMQDLEAASRHLRTLESEGLSETQRSRIMTMQVMVWLQIGDLRAAKRCLSTLYESTNTVTSPTLEAMDSSTSDDHATHVLHALAQMAEGKFAEAADEWETLLTEPGYESDDMAVQNRAICLLYTGRMHEASQLLEQAVEQSEVAPFHPLLFNLCTFYELTSDRARETKMGLMERVARVEPASIGWQRPTADFKMELLRA